MLCPSTETCIPKGDKQRLQKCIKWFPGVVQTWLTLGNQSHSWHFRAAAKPLGNTLTQCPRFAAEMWDAQTANRTFQSDSSRKDKIGGGTRPFLPRREWACGPLPLCSDHERIGGQLMFINVTSHTSLGSPVLQGSFLPESVTHAAPKVCEAPGHSLHITGPITPRGCKVLLTIVIWTWTANVEMGCFTSPSFSFINNSRNTGKTLITHTPFYVCLHGNDRDGYLDIISESHHLMGNRRGKQHFFGL